MPDGLSDEDKRLFHAHMNGVTPLTNTSKHSEKKTSKHASPIKSHVRTSTKPKHMPLKKLEIYLSSAYQNIVYADTQLSFNRGELANSRFRELKNGFIPYQGRLDLHGKRSEEAQDTLLTFLAEQINQDHRCLLIIHGKGGLDTETPPVLKNLINHWLKQIPEVLAFHSALPRHGGAGAVYVFLKKNISDGSLNAFK